MLPASPTKTSRPTCSPSPVDAHHPCNQPTPSTRTLLLGLWGHLSRRRRIQLVLLLVVMLASGGAELVSLGAVLPFLAVLSDPERLWQQPLVQALAGRVGFTEASEMLLPATLVFAAAAVLAAVIRLANLWLNGRLADQLRVAVVSDLSCEAYRRTPTEQEAYGRGFPLSRQELQPERTPKPSAASNARCHQALHELQP